MTIALLLISIVAMAGAVFVCVMEPTVQNGLLAVLLLLCVVWFGRQLTRRK